MDELVPWRDGAVPHEDGALERHVKGRVQRVVLCLDAESAVPGEGVPGHEGDSVPLGSIMPQELQRRARARYWRWESSRGRQAASPRPNAAIP